jgi:hypothetical protein
LSATGSDWVALLSSRDVVAAVVVVVDAVYDAVVEVKVPPVTINSKRNSAGFVRSGHAKPSDSKYSMTSSVGPE